MTKKPNLDTLKRTGPRSQSGSRRLSAFLVPIVLLLGFCLLLFFVFGDRLRPRMSVSVANVLLLDVSEGQMSSSVPASERPLARASGWIEADPYLIQVPAKAAGFVDHVHVLEGQSVTNGQAIASLDPSDRVLALREVRARAEAERHALAALKADINASMLAVSQAVVRVRSTEASLHEASDHVRRLQGLTEFDVSEIEITAAERKLATLTAARDAAALEVPTSRAHVVGLQAQQARLVNTISALDAEVSLANLQLTRMRIHAPTNGVVLKRHVDPGDVVSEKNADRAVVTLFDPQKLQVRVDVPLSDITHIQKGQTAHITSGAFPGQTFHGVVTRIVGQADIARNTLQVKVTIKHPHERMRPEMLCRVEFLASTRSGEQGIQGGATALWVAKAALGNTSGSDAQVWVVDPITAKVSPRDIHVGTQTQDGLVPVIDGLNAGMKVVVGDTSQLKPGALVRITGGEQ